jgi:hypothetical protein
MSKFEDNGGYYIDGVPYMDCKYTGIPVKNVSEDVKYVISDQALQSRMYKMFPEDFAEKEKYKPTGRPAGWHFMNEFARHKEKLAANRQLKKDLDKQKKFLMGEVDK